MAHKMIQTAIIINRENRFKRLMNAPFKFCIKCYAEAHQHFVRVQNRYDVQNF